MVSTTSGNSASIAAPIAFNARIKGPIGEPFSWAITASSDCEGRNRNVSSIHQFIKSLPYAFRRPVLA